MYVEQVTCHSCTKFQLPSAYRLAKCPDRHLLQFNGLYELSPFSHRVDIEMLKKILYRVFAFKSIENVIVKLTMVTPALFVSVKNWQ